MVEDEKPAFDAPREANKETIEREAPEQHTEAQRLAPPTEQSAKTPAPPQPPEATANAEVQAPQEDAPVKPADENPNAEALDKAEPAPEKSQPKRSARRQQGADDKGEEDHPGGPAGFARPDAGLSSRLRREALAGRRRNREDHLSVDPVRPDHAPVPFPARPAGNRISRWRASSPSTSMNAGI